MLQRAGMQKILIDGGQFIGELGQILGICWRKFGRRRFRVRTGVEPHNKCLDRPGDIFQLKLAQRLESQVEPSVHMIPNGS